MAKSKPESTDQREMKEYHRPTVKVLGDFLTLTRGGTKSSNERGTGNPGTKV